MLQAINDRIKGWLGIAIVILIGLPFALWGIQSYLDDTGPQYAAKVNGTEISAQEFERSVSMQRQALVRQSGGKLPMEESALRQRTLSQLINQRLLEETTYNNGYRISNTVLSERIRQQFTVDGVFDRERFEMGVASIGMSIPGYEQALRNELRLQQMQTAISNTAFVTKHEVEELARLDQQTRDISVATFNVEHFSTAAKPAAEEIQQYYEDNSQRFMMPEKVRIDYVEITADSLAEGIAVDEEQVKKMYDDYVAVISKREERRASHILINTSEDKAAAKIEIEALKKELDNGADFSDLAKKNSQDTASAVNGGDLDWVAIGEMVKPFEQALFELKKGEISGIVETQFGYHLIKLADVRSEAVQPLAIKRYEFEDELKADSVASIFYDLSERLASIAYENPDNLDLVVEDLGLKIQSSDYITRSDGEGIAKDNKVRTTAFSAAVLDEGGNSDVIELSPTHVVVLRVSEHIPAKPVPLQEVSSRIENILKVENGHKQTMAAALEIKAKIEAGEPLESLKGDGFSVEIITTLSRTDVAKAGDPSILQIAFALPVSQAEGATPAKKAVKEIDLMSGDVALVVLDKVNSVDEIAQDKLEIVKSQVLRDNVLRDYSSALLAIKDNAEIETNKRVIE